MTTTPTQIRYGIIGAGMRVDSRLLSLWIGYQPKASSSRIPLVG